LFPSCCWDESADRKAIQKAGPAEMCAEKREPPSSDGSIIGEQNWFYPTARPATAILTSKRSGGGFSFSPLWWLEYRACTRCPNLTSSQYVNVTTTM